MRILVADDDNLSRRLLQGVLTRADHDVVLAEDGYQAWGVLEQPDAPKVAILDWAMPGIDGIDLCKRIRSQPDASYRYVLLLTARTEKEDIVRGFEAGVDDYLLKPVDAAQLLARLYAGQRILNLHERLVNAHSHALEEHERIKLLLDSTAEGIVGMDLEGNCTFCNRASLSQFGHETEVGLIGRNVHDLHHHSHADGTPYPREECKAHHPVETNASLHADDEVFWRLDGTSFPVEFWSYPVLREKRVVGSVITFWDITPRRQAQHAQRRSEQLFRSIAENTADLIAVVDGNGRRVYNNPSYQRILGYTPEELKGTVGFEQIHPDDRERVVRGAAEALRTGEGKVLEYRMRRRDGSYVTLESHSSFIRDAAGDVENLVISARDVGPRRAAEQMQKLEAIGQLAAGIAHEINTPVQYVSDNISFLRKAWDQVAPAIVFCSGLDAQFKAGCEDARHLFDESGIAVRDLGWLQVEVPKALAQSLEGTQRISRIVGAMRRFSHSTSGEKSPVDINDAMETTLTVARNEVKHVADVETFYQADLPQVVCCSGEINQVLLNLIVNAAHAIDESRRNQQRDRGRLVIRTMAVEEDVQIEIQDDGVGIPDNIRPRIFEPFFTTKEVGRGTGQGLAICHDIVVRKHGGKLWFDTEVGRGTTFFIRLPIKPSGDSKGAK